MGDLTTNFSKSEFACKCCGQSKMSLAHVKLLQQLREHLGKPIHILSGYRCKAHNTKVGGAARSQHMLGTATDIRVEGLTPDELAKAIESFHNFPGLGIYRSQNFVHVDSRTAGRWRGIK